MEFFDKLGETISEKSKDVAKKAKEVAEIASLNNKISNQEKNIKKIYADIGQKIYEKYKNDSSNEFYEECKIVTEAFDEISKIKSEIQLLKNYKICSHCGAQVPVDASFCSKCGSKIEKSNSEKEAQNKEAKVSEDAEIVNCLCPNCNEILEDDVKYCTKCDKQIID